jgi:hypothetical protein
MKKGIYLVLSLASKMVLLFLVTSTFLAKAQLTPTTWDFTANSTGWSGNFGYRPNSNASMCGSAGMRYKLSWSDQVGNLVSPVLPGTNNGGLVTVTYKYKATNFSDSGPANWWGSFDVQYGTNSTGPWTTFATVSQETQTGSCLTKTHTFYPPSGNLFLKFNCQWTAGDYYLSFDDIQIVSQSVEPNCQLNPQIVSSPVQVGGCVNYLLTSYRFTNNNMVWRRDGEIIPGADSTSYLITSIENSGNHTYTFENFCPASGQTLVSNALEINSQSCYYDYSSPINYLLVQNVTTTGINSTNQTAQIQFDLNWGYSWKDSINWDAAWVFMKYKTATGEWKPCKIKTTGFDHGQGTLNNIQVSSDQMGAFVSMSQYGNAHVDIQGMQLQWDYSAQGLSNPGAVEVKVFAVEMVYIPQGEFYLFRDYGGATIAAPGNNCGVINTRFTPVLTYSGGTCRVKGDAGLDSNADGTIDNPDYPTGYTPFYAFKYEMSDQQYADFLNCLTTTQITTLGIAGSSITINNGVYFASAPNRACKGFTDARALAYADWSGLRPLSILEFSKAALGPYNFPTPSFNPIGGSYAAITPADVGSGDGNGSTRSASGSGYYGMKDMGCNVAEEVVNLNFINFSKNFHGNGILNTLGNSDVGNWAGLSMVYCEPYADVIFAGGSYMSQRGFGFRFARTAE